MYLLYLFNYSFYVITKFPDTTCPNSMSPIYKGKIWEKNIKRNVVTSKDMLIVFSNFGIMGVPQIRRKRFVI